jgi:hypothetical protein
MTGFTSIENYAPWLVLLAGAFTIAGILGVGNQLGRALRLPQPWLTAVGAIAAIELLTGLVEAVAMAQFATRTILIVVWALFSAIGALLLVTHAPRFETLRFDSLTGVAVAAILVVNLLIALCPSTKEDEVYYHMLVPSRIVQDGGLHFYREPLRAAIYPQMAFQMGLAPFHALGLPDAGNVVSWFFSVLLVWFTYRIVYAYSESTRWSGLFALAIAAGLYTSIWHVTSGPHAIGDLAVTVVIVALYAAENLIATTGPIRLALTVGILAAAAASTKVLLFPFAFAVILIAAVAIGRLVVGFRHRAWIVACLILPAILFIIPLMSWTALHAGSPLGPLLEGRTGPSPYQPGEVRAFLDDYVAGIRGPIAQKVRNEAVSYSPIVWLAIAAFCFGRRRLRVAPTIGVALFLIQVVVILGWNTYDARYFGGVHYALMILFGMFLTSDARDAILANRRVMIGLTFLIVPWMLLQFAYSAQFLKLVLGLESKAQFLSSHVAFFQDFEALDRILPRDAVVLVFPYGLDSIYVPRPVYYHPLDLPSHRPTFLFAYEPHGDPRGTTPANFVREQQVYANAGAVTAAFREPGRPPVHGGARVWRLRSQEVPR